MHGFSLLEVMLVLVLLGGVAMLAISALPKNASLQKESDKISATLRWAMEHATQDGQMYGFAVASGEWQLMKLTAATDGQNTSYYWPGHRWQPVAIGKQPQQRTLPIGQSLRLMIDGQEHPISSTLPEQNPEPRILLLPGGEISHFELHLLSDNQPLHQISLDQGKIVQGV
jgi:general secretion pathway protein H